MTNDEIADLLDRAADLLFVYGRCTGSGAKPDGSMCVRGAIAYAAGGPPEIAFGTWGLPWRPAIDAIDDYLARHPEVLPRNSDGSIHCGDIIEDEGRYPAWIFNDRTEDDGLVIDTVKRCAKELRDA